MPIGGPVFHRRSIEVEHDGALAVKVYREMALLQSERITIPLSGCLHHVFGRRHGTDDSAAIVITRFRETKSIEDLQLDSLGHRIKRIGDAEKDPRVAGWFDLEFQIQDIVAILPFGKKIGVVALPTGFASPRLKRDRTVRIVDPIALGLPAAEVLTIEQRDETSRVWRRMGDGSDRRADREILLGGRTNQREKQAGEQGEATHTHSLADPPAKASLHLSLDSVLPNNKDNVMGRPTQIFLCLLAAASLCPAAPPANLVVEGVPEAPATLAAELAPYLNLGGASFRGWHSTRREIVVTTRIGEATHLHLSAAPLAKRIPLTHGTEPVKSGWMQPGGKLLLYSVDVGGSENFQLYLQDTQDLKAKAILLTDGKSRNTDPVWSKDGRRIAYASNRRNGKDSDIIVTQADATHTEKVLLTATSSGWSPVEWSQQNKQLLLRQSFGLNETRLWLADIQTQKRTPVTQASGHDYLTQIAFGEDDQAVYALSNHDSDFLTPTRIDVATGAMRQVDPTQKWDGEELAISADGKILAVTVNVEGFSEIHSWEIPSLRPVAVPKVKAGIVSNLLFRPQSHELGFTLKSEDSASDAWSVDLDSGNSIRWTDRTTKPKKVIDTIEPTIVRVKSFDGLSVPALVYYPDPKKFPGRRPSLMMAHGGPEGQSRPGYRGSLLYYLNERGVALVYPNIRGSTGYGRKYLNLDNGLLREGALRDIEAILDWTDQSPRLDPKKVAVSGGSYGGFVSLACLVNFPTRFRCGVDDVGIANFVTFLHDTSDYRRGARRLEYGDERKPEIRAFLEKISPANHADQIRAPLLIIQGKNDPRVPVTEAERMRDAVRAQGGTVWYLMAKDEGHGFSKKSNVDFQFQTTALFLEEFLIK